MNAETGIEDPGEEQDTNVDTEVVDDIPGVDTQDWTVEEHVSSETGGDPIETQAGPVAGTTDVPLPTPMTVSGKPIRERRPPKPSYEPSMTGKKYGYAMATIMGNLFMGQELREAGEHHRPEVIVSMMVQLSMKAATAKERFGQERHA